MTTDASAYQLYWAPNTGAFAPHAILEECSAQYILTEVDYDNDAQHSESFLAINPRGQIPVLRLPSGTYLTETLAMVMHLADCFAQAQLIPAPGQDDRAQVYRWLAFMLSNLYESDLRYYYADRYTTDSTGSDGVKEAAEQDLYNKLALSETLLARGAGDGPFILGSTYSIADPYLAMVACWAPDYERMRREFTRIATLVDNVRQRPAIRRIWQQNFPHIK
jgi:glutathione S-transferase